MTENKIEVASCTIKELFSEKIPDTTIFGELEVPEYQRPYVWTEKEIDKLIADLKDHHKKQSDKPMYYLGSIILHKHDNKLSIIDGQQRLTTLAIIQHILDINKVPKVKYATPATITHIKKNYNYLKGKKEELNNLVNFDTLNVTLVVTNSEDDAYTFFETQNTGGVRLSGIDIIKAHHLREIDSRGKRDEQYARIWEKQKNIKTVIEQLIKARRWNALFWKYVPLYRDEKGIKQTIIKDFSQKTLDRSQKAAYLQIISTNNYSSIQISPYKLAIRQPLANGENFIDYLEQFADLYQRLFINESDAEISIEYYDFNKRIIKIVDGTAFLKEFYEIALMCYVNKYGVRNLLEASYWIFRYTYSLRVSNAKMVFERSIPSFIEKGNYIFDIILSSFNHEQLVNLLKQFKYEFNNENSEDNSVKKRFIGRVADFFQLPEISNTNKFDDYLKKGIEKKLDKGGNNGKI